MAEPSTYTVMDLWTIGIGISGVFTTIIAVGVAIAVPAWQRQKEIHAARDEKKAQYVAILAWLRNELERLESLVEQRIIDDNIYTGELFFAFENLDIFNLDIPSNIHQLKNSPILLTTCPPSLTRLLWNLNELEIDIKSLSKNWDENAKLTYKDLKEYFDQMHYRPILKDLSDLYELSFNLGLEIRRNTLDKSQIGIRR